MIQWQLHDSFLNEFKKISKKHRSLDDDFEKVKKLLDKYFDPINPNTNVISPGKIHRLHNYADWALWKVEVMVVGLKPGLWPRVWFAVSGDTITFLVIDMHNSGYDDNTLEKCALDRYEY